MYRSAILLGQRHFLPINRYFSSFLSPFSSICFSVTLFFLCLFTWTTSANIKIPLSLRYRYLSLSYHYRSFKYMPKSSYCTCFRYNFNKIYIQHLLHNFFLSLKFTPHFVITIPLLSSLHYFEFFFYAKPSCANIQQCRSHTTLLLTSNKNLLPYKISQHSLNFNHLNPIFLLLNAF